MRSPVCFDAFHLDKLRLLIEVRDADRASFFEGYRGSHTAFLFRLLAFGHDYRQMMQRVETVQDPIRLLVCYIHTKAYPYHQFLHWDADNPFHQVTLGISVGVGPHIQLGFFIQQLASERWSGIIFMRVRRLSGCAHWGIPHTLSCSLIQTIGSSVIYFRVVFLLRHLHIRCPHWGIPPIGFFC